MSFTIFCISMLWMTSTASHAHWHSVRGSVFEGDIVFVTARNAVIPNRHRLTEQRQLVVVAAEDEAWPDTAVALDRTTPIIVGHNRLVLGHSVAFGTFDSVANSINWGLALVGSLDDGTALLIGDSDVVIPYLPPTNTQPVE